VGRRRSVRRRRRGLLDQGRLEYGERRDRPAGLGSDRVGRGARQVHGRLSHEEAVLAVRRDVLFDGGRESVHPPQASARAIPNITTSRTTRCRSGSGRSKSSAGTGAASRDGCQPALLARRPKLDEVIFKIIPDRNTLESQIQAHEVDLWYTMPGSYLDRLRDTPGFTTFKKPGYIYNHIDFNLQRPGDSDPAVRAAIRLATDRATILQKIGHGLGSLQDVTTPLTAPYSVTSIQKTRSTSRKPMLCSTRPAGSSAPTACARRTVLGWRSISTRSRDRTIRTSRLNSSVRRGSRSASRFPSITCSRRSCSRRQRKAASSMATSGTSFSLLGRTKRSVT